MPRTARASVGDICYHVINRGNAQIEVFHKDGDYRAFVELIGLACQRISMRVLAYCVITWLCGLVQIKTSAVGCNGF
jgi:putative transposase